MKAEGGKASPEQDWWIEGLNAVGSYARIYHGWESAVRVLGWRGLKGE